MICPQHPTYLLIQSCLKEALYAGWKQDTEQTQRYLLLARSRIQELQQLHQAVYQHPTLLSREPSLHPYPKFLQMLVQTTFQYARTCKICHFQAAIAPADPSR